MRRTIVLVALIALGLVPTTTAHTNVSTTDGKYLVTVGNLNEPVTTFMKTGLDLVVRENTTARTGVTGAHLTLQATLKAPSGKELTQPLRAQFGTTGSYSFTYPYILTEAGEYRLRVTGRINATDVNFPSILVGSGPIPAIEDHFFPDDALASPKQLEARVKALEDARSTTTSAKGSPGFDLVGVALLAGIVGVVFGRRRQG